MQQQQQRKRQHHRAVWEFELGAEHWALATAAWDRSCGSRSLGVQGTVAGSDDLEESSDAAASDSADTIQLYTSDASSSEDASSSC